MIVMRQMSSGGGVTAAVQDMDAMEEQGRLRRWRQGRLDQAIRVLDELIGDIEQLNLEERSRVPLGWQPRLAEMAAALPVECGDRLRAGISPQRLLDQVYEIQQEVFWLKQGKSAEELRLVDLELEGLALN
jgi:hypothetical protein